MFAKLTEFLKPMNLIGLGFASMLCSTNPALSSAPCTCGYAVYHPFNETQRVCATLRQDSWSQGGCTNRCGAYRDCLFQGLKIDGYGVVPDHKVDPTIFYDADGANKCKAWGEQSAYTVTVVTDHCT